MTLIQYVDAPACSFAGRGIIFGFFFLSAVLFPPRRCCVLQFYSADDRHYDNLDEGIHHPLGMLQVNVVRAFHSGQSHHAEAQFHAVVYQFILHILLEQQWGELL